MIDFRWHDHAIPLSPGPHSEDVIESFGSSLKVTKAHNEQIEIGHVQRPVILMVREIRRFADLLFVHRQSSLPRVEKDVERDWDGQRSMEELVDQPVSLQAIDGVHDFVMSVSVVLVESISI